MAICMAIPVEQKIVDFSNYQKNKLIIDYGKELFIVALIRLPQIFCYLSKYASWNDTLNKDQHNQNFYFFR